MIYQYKDIKMHYEPHLDGGGREVYPAFLRAITGKIGSVKTAFEFCAGTAFIGFSLLADNVCERIILADIEKESVECCRRTIEENHLEKRAEVYLSDGLSQIPPQKWDLVVGNPPHFSERQINLPQNTIINVDTNWDIHRNFYKNIGKYLNPDASILLVENGRGSNPAFFEGMIRESGDLRFEDALECRLNRPSKFYFMWAKKDDPVIMRMFD
jgi:methylase of polypeptide subunit release factors